MRRRRLKYFVEHQIKSYAWDIDGRSGRLPAVAGQIEVNEFPHDELSMVYNENGVVVRTIPAIHALDGPVSFILEWNNLKLAYSSDTFPNKWWMEHAVGADIAIHEAFITPESLVESRETLVGPWSN